MPFISNCGVLALCVVCCAGLAAETTAEVWTLTDAFDKGDRKQQRLESQAVAFEPLADDDAVAIAIDADTTYQSFTGVGMSFDRCAMMNFVRLAPADRNAALRRLFDPDHPEGFGLSMIRFPLGTADFTGTEWYSYNDMPAGQTDPEFEHFSIHRDQEEGFTDLLREVKAINPDLLIVTSLWSPPGWMKTNDKLTDGGHLIAGNEPLLAAYIRKAFDAYRAEGIEFDALTIQNEPEVKQVYPSCKWSTEQLLLAQEHVSAALTDGGYDTAIWAGDTQWSNSDRFQRPQIEQAVANGNQRVRGAAWHWYGGKPSAMSDLHADFPQMQNILTEIQLANKNSGRGKMHKCVDYFHNWCNGFIDWIGFLDSKGKPINQGVPWRPGKGKFVGADHNDFSDWWFEDLAFKYGMIGRWVERGALRIASPRKVSGNVFVVAFRNRDGRYAVTLFTNTDKNDSAGGSYKVVWNGQQCIFDLPSEHCIATVTWQGPSLARSIGVDNFPGFDWDCFPGGEGTVVGGRTVFDALDPTVEHALVPVGNHDG